MASSVLNIDGIVFRHWKNAHAASIPPRGFVWLQHGLGEHSGRYDGLATYLSQYGWDVLGPDLPGHGLTLEAGKYTNLMGPSELVPILDSVRRKISFNETLNFGSAFIKSKKYLVGHSLGALICARWLSDPTFNSEEYRWDSAFLSAPPFELKLPVPKWKLGLARVLKNISPDLKIGNEISSQDLSVETVNQAEYKADPLVHGKASPRLFWDVRESSKFCFKNVKMIEIPICLAYGGLDPIVSARAIRDYYEVLNTYKKLLEFSKSKHEIFNDLEKKYVYEAVSKWLIHSL